jgi:putative PIG3 family NAD(P)H quinone oxidoreductase
MVYRMTERVECMRYRAAGGAEVIEVGEVEVREPGHGEVTVEIVAAGLNRADVLQRRGFYPAPPGSPPDVPGLELAGRVARRGPGATLWKDGDAVMAIVGGGAMARRITLHERELIPVPAPLSLDDAAAIPEAFLTAWDAMIRQAGLRAGATALIHAAGSGVGTAAIQLARAVGARPLGTSRRAGKLEAVRPLGLAEGDGIVVGDPPAFAAEVARLTGGRGAEVVLDTVGGTYLEENVRAVATRGRIVLLATAGGGTGKAPITMMLGKRVTVIGSVMRARPLEEKIDLARGAAAELVPLFARGILRPVVDRVLPMRELAAAHARMEADENVGKIVLRWD